MIQVLRKIQNSCTQHTSVKSIAVLSVLLSFALTVFYTNIIFYQFPLYKIILLSILFLLLLTILTYIFDRNYFKENFYFNTCTFISASALVLVLVMLGSTALEDATYYRAFPLLEANLGLGAHPDSSYHIALIQSILTFGYPSTGQHDVPIVFYHILSHYIDSIILSITGLDPFDSYGLLYDFKVIFFLSSIIIFISQVLKKASLGIFILSFFVLSPMLVSTWTPVFSHALWFTSILTILSSTFLYKLLIKEEKLKYKEYLFLFLFIILISIGKVSLGFLYATFIGMYLLLKDWKDYRLYLTGGLWILFFIVFQKLLNPDVGHASASHFNLTSLFDFFMAISKSLYGMLESIYISIILLIILALLFKSKQNLRFAAASFFSLLVVGIVVVTHKNFIAVDIFYFEYSLDFILILFIFQIAFKYIATTKQQFWTLLLFTVLVLHFYYLPKFNILSPSFQKSLHMLNNRPFIHLNRRFSEHTFDVIHGGLPKNWVQKLPQPITKLKYSLHTYMAQKHFEPKNTLLFIPKELYSKDLIFITSKQWSLGLFIYSAIGIPLIYGNKTLYRGYGYKNYTKESLWVSQTDFNRTEACRFNKNIIILKSFNPATFESFECNKTKPQK